MMTMIPITLHDSIKPAGLVRRGVAKFVRIRLAGYACEGERSESERSMTER